MNTAPTLSEWVGKKPPEIRTVGSLQGRLPPGHYSQVYWIVQLRQKDNVIIELQPLKTWYFAPDGRLLGETEIEGWRRLVEIAVDEYVVLSVK